MKLKYNNKIVSIRSKLKQACILLIIVMILIIGTSASHGRAMVTEQKYGILIGAQNGSYTFYDLSDSTQGNAIIEITNTGTIMVPIKALVKLIPGLSYQYEKSNKKVTIINTLNQKRITLTKNSKYLYYYSSLKAKPVKKKMNDIVYTSKASSAIMVPMNAIRYLFTTTKGFATYSIKEMQAMGYDTEQYGGLLVYNPYQAAAPLPKAANVTGITSTVKVTIPEGYSVAQIFDLLVKKGVSSSTKSFYDAMESYDFSYYPLVSQINEDNNRCFRLEGYLYPDTYEFYRLSKPQDVIGKFLRNLETKVSESDRQKATQMGYRMDQILIIASMIEKETPKHEMMPQIASVIYNRLEIDKKLQFDSTIYYVERYIKPYIDGDINRYNSYYNTYKCPQLPSGPICNPGRAAIQAALNPADTDYLYFYSDIAGEYHFSKEYVNPETTEASE